MPLLFQELGLDVAAPNVDNGGQSNSKLPPFANQLVTALDFWALVKDGLPWR